MKDSSTTIEEVMRRICTISSTATLKEALESMIDQKTNTIFVVDEEGKLIGEVSVVHLLKGIVPGYVASDAIAAHFLNEESFGKAIEEANGKAVTEFMYTDVKPIDVNGGLMQAAVIAIDRGQARIPVVDENNKPVGVISRMGLKAILASHLDIPFSTE